MFKPRVKRHGAKSKNYSVVVRYHAIITYIRK